MQNDTTTRREGAAGDARPLVDALAELLLDLDRLAERVDDVPLNRALGFAHANVETALRRALRLADLPPQQADR